jgi:hypothetical protein
VILIVLTTPHRQPASATVASTAIGKDASRVIVHVPPALALPIRNAPLVGELAVLTATADVVVDAQQDNTSVLTIIVCLVLLTAFFVSQAIAAQLAQAVTILVYQL